MDLTIGGFRFAGMHAGIKASGAPDLGLIDAVDPAGRPVKVAATFTASRAAAAPVVLSRERAARGRCRAVVVNSGNANACTGRRGYADAKAMAAGAAMALGVDDASVLVASTGVIGAPMPMAAVGGALPELARRLDPAGFEAFARAILTTDRAEKIAVREGRVAGRKVRVVGAAKGAGMIMPDMTLAVPAGRGHATMLAFVCTDAAVGLPALRRLTRDAVDESFNAITVDGDTSTNDSVFVLASGHAGNRPVAGGPAATALSRLLEGVMVDLARAIVRDGEGASHLVAIRVEGARSVAEADRIARRIANSPLVKTAIHGEDPNWGRIVAAAATAGVALNPEALDLLIGGVPVYRRGRWLGAEAEAEAHRVMAGDAYEVRLRLRRGRAARRLWACDLSAEYVRINADYRS